MKNNLFQETFVHEVKRLLDDMEGALIDLVECPGDQQAVERIIGALHTIAEGGEGAGFPTAARFAAGLAERFSLVQSGHIPASREMIGLFLLGLDRLAARFRGDERESEGEKKILESLDRFMPVASGIRDEKRESGSGDGRGAD